MATYTTRLNLKKPDPSDFYNIEDFNGNADKIDAKMLRIDDDKASQVDAETGSDDTKWMSPLRVRQGINILKASQTEAETGSNDTKWMSPLKVRQGINILKANQSEAQAGTNDTKWMTPLRVKNFHDSIKSSVSEAQAGTNDTKWVTPIGLKSSIKLYERSSYIAFCSNINADSLDAAFGKNNESTMLSIGRQLAMYSWFKGTSQSSNPYSTIAGIDTFRSIYANLTAIMEVEATSALIDLINLSPFAKSIRDSALSNESTVCQVIAKKSGLPNTSSFTTVLSLTNNSTFMNSQASVAMAFTYPKFVSSFCSNNTNWARMANYKPCMLAFQGSDEVDNYLLDNKATLLTYMNDAGGTNASTPLTGNVVYMHRCQTINSGNYSNNSFSIGTDLDGRTYSDSGYGDDVSASISRKFFKPSTCSKGGGGGVTCYYKKIS